MKLRYESGDSKLRLAWLPVVFISEHQAMFAQYGRDEGIEEAYRDVTITSLWVYLLYTYHGLVRRRFGTATEARVREYQREIFNDEQPGSGDDIMTALELVDGAVRAGVQIEPDWSIQFKLPAELAVALALLLGLPESPDYRSRKPKPSDYAVHRMPGVDWRLARVLTRAKKELTRTFSPVIEKFDCLPEQVLAH